MIEGYQAQNQQVGGLAQGLQVACRVQCLQQAQAPCPGAVTSRPPSTPSFACSYLVQDPRGPYWRFLKCTLPPSLKVASRLALKLDASAREVAAVEGVPRPPPLSPLPFANGEVSARVEGVPGCRRSRRSPLPTARWGCTRASPSYSSTRSIGTQGKHCSSFPLPQSNTWLPPPIPCVQAELEGLLSQQSQLAITMEAELARTEACFRDLEGDVQVRGRGRGGCGGQRDPLRPAAGGRGPALGRLPLPVRKATRAQTRTNRTSPLPPPQVQGNCSEKNQLPPLPPHVQCKCLENDRTAYAPSLPPLVFRVTAQRFNSWRLRSLGWWQPRRTRRD